MAFLMKVPLIGLASGGAWFILHIAQYLYLNFAPFRH